jgi:hypothetical protein
MAQTPQGPINEDARGLGRIIRNKHNSGWCIHRSVHRGCFEGRILVGCKQKLRFEEKQEAAGRAADLEALRIIWHYLIFEAKARGDAHERLRGAIDDYTEEITGDRTTLYAKPANIGR